MNVHPYCFDNVAYLALFFRFVCKMMFNGSVDITGVFYAIPSIEQNMQIYCVKHRLYLDI